MLYAQPAVNGRLDKISLSMHSPCSMSFRLSVNATRRGRWHWPTAYPRKSVRTHWHSPQLSNPGKPPCACCGKPRKPYHAARYGWHRIWIWLASHAWHLPSIPRLDICCSRGHSHISEIITGWRLTPRRHWRITVPASIRRNAVCCWRSLLQNYHCKHRRHSQTGLIIRSGRLPKPDGLPPDADRAVAMLQAIPDVGTRVNAARFILHYLPASASARASQSFKQFEDDNFELRVPGLPDGW